MADESENPALAMLLKLESRLDGLSDELMAVKSRLAYVEGRLATVEARLAELEAERDALLASESRMPRAVAQVSLEIAGVAPSLQPGEDQDELVELIRRIRARRTAVNVLSDDERTALEEAWQCGIVSAEEIAAFFKRRGIG
jgi:phage shock protein A